MRTLLLVYGLLYVLATSAQELPQRTQQQLEGLAEVLEGELEDDGWWQQLEHYRKHPLSINKATADDLRSLRLLTDLQIHNLLQYRALLGKLVDVYELQAVPGWHPEIIQRLLPFITVREEVAIGEAVRKRLKGGEHTLLLSNSRVLERQRGYRALAASPYLGSPDHLQLRYQYRHKKGLQLGLTADKDAGEPFFGRAGPKGFDFYSGHLFARKLGVVKALALGDYTVNLGQGLVHWQSLAFGKSAEVINIKRQSPVLQPYSAAGEYYFNRGAGLTLQKGRVEATAFASYRALTGNRVTDTLTGKELISSIRYSGYHRTGSEIEDRNSAELTVIGGALALKQNRFSLGLNAVRSQLDKTLQKRDDPYNLYALQGKDWANYSLDYSATYRNAHLFGEVAVDGQFDKAFIQGALLSVHPAVDLALLYRDIAPGYQSFSGRAFTESVLPTNEKGFYMGISIRPTPIYKIDAYADFYRFPWLKYRVDAPSQGRDYSVQLSYRPHKRLEINARYRNEQKSLNAYALPDSVLYAPQAQVRHMLRFHLEYQLHRQVWVRSRVEGVRFGIPGNSHEHGLSSYIEGIWKPGSMFSANLRLHYFSTDTYNSRIYAYESDLLYHYYIPAFFDQGIRYYIRLNWDAGERVSFWLRWAQTLYTDLRIIGSGLDEIEGSRRTEARLQMRLTF